MVVSCVFMPKPHFFAPTALSLFHRASIVFSVQLKSTASVAVVGSKAAFETYNSEAGDADKLNIVDPFSQE